MRILALVLVLLLVACGQPQIAVQPPPVLPTATAAPTAVPATPTPMRECTDKLNGLWAQDTSTGVVEWLIDIDGERPSLGASANDDGTRITVEREDGKTVYVTLHGVERRDDTFRFINDDLVIWTLGKDGRTIQLQRVQ